MNNPFDYIPSEECDEAFRQLIAQIENLKGSALPDDINFCRELEGGKMLGVLIATDARGERHALYAFSGQLGQNGFNFPGFVGAVFDYLEPDGYFKTRETDISRQNKEIAWYEKNVLADAIRRYEEVKRELDADVVEYKEYCRRAKADRGARRHAGVANEEEIAAMIRQSQFEKAELHRLKKRVSSRLRPFESELEKARRQLDAMKEKRRSDSESLQNWLFTHFRVLNARGESRSLTEIFADTPMRIPPSGAGECCAPKLLQEAYMRGWHPVSMAEYWYGSPKEGEVRTHGVPYPACRGKCLPLLSWMLQGLSIEPALGSENDVEEPYEPEILFENKWFCVVSKPSGMLSVPGKGEAFSVQQWLQKKYGDEQFVKVAHRLDQDTSGLLIAALSPLSFKLMQSLFASRKVKKTYVADLEGDYESKGVSRRGRISLPLSPDWLDRPRQRIDFVDGKEAVTDYEFTGVAEGCSRILFYPLTGRTHQLRVHSASLSGLGMPIVGDRLYGGKKIHTCVSVGNPGDACCRKERLHLHARKIEFIWPKDNRHYSFEIEAPF